MSYSRNERLTSEMLPVDIVLGPAWWFHHEAITFDEDFFFHPAQRVEVERKMERVLYERWGQFGLGADHDTDRPVVGPVHLAAGYLTPAMLGCRIQFSQDAAPQVIPAGLDSLTISAEAAFASPVYRRFEKLLDALKSRFGYLQGDVGWGGLLNTSLDLRGQAFLMDLLDQPEAASRFLADIAAVDERFTDRMAAATGSTSISVNRNVRHIREPVYLHSECSHVMISVGLYEQFLLGFDVAWSQTRRPYGIHYCGADPHRYARAFAKIPHLDFLDVGWGGNVAELRRHLPSTFLNLRLSPVEIVKKSPEEIRRTIRELVGQSGNPWLTGVCCINMDQQVTDQQVTAIFEAVSELRGEYGAAG